MSTRSIAVRLRAEVSDFNREISSAASSLDQVVKRAGEGERAADTFAGRVAQSARLQRQEWTTVGTALTAVGTAVTGLGAAVLHTGISYNTLRQTATAGLTTMLGSAEAAADQMDRLDTFASTSPFARQVWITAQQQLIGFGVEAGRVIPILDGVQDAVAAVGGSNADIERIVYALAQMQSQGRLTGQTLNQVGQYGIDMATIIGEQTGRSGEQIREMAMRPGGIPVEEIWDPLIAGLNENFGGAAANVRETFEGALDRVKAAWRDISALIARPLVDPEGGGALIGWLNGLADAMRRFESLPDGLVQAIGWVTGLGGAATLTAGALFLAIPRYLEFRTSLQSLSDIAPRASRAIGGLNRVVGRIAVGGAAIAGLSLLAGQLAEFATKGREGAAGLEETRLALLQLDSAADLDNMFEFGGAVTDLDSAFQILTSNEAPAWIERFGSGLADLLPGFRNVHNPVREASEQFENIGQALAALVNDGEAAAAAELFDLVAGALGLTGEEVDVLLDLMPAYSEAMAGAAADAEMLDQAATQASDGLDEMRQGWIENQEAAKELREEWLSLGAQAGETFGDIAAAFGVAQDAQEEFGLSAAQTMDAWIEEMQAQAEAAANWGQNWVTASEQVRDELPANMQEAASAFVDEMAHAGDEGARMLQLFVDGTPEQRQELIEAWMGTGSEIGEQIAEEVESARNPRIDIDDLPARSGHEALIDDINTSTADTSVGADMTPAEAAVAWAQESWEGTTTDTMLSADPSKAMQVFDEETGAWRTTTTQTNLDLDPDQSIRVFDRETGRWVRTTTQTMLDMDPDKAARRYGVVTSEWRTDTTTTNLDANTNPARGDVRGFGSWASNYPVNVNVSANVAAAQARIRSLNQQRVQIGADLLRASGGPVFGPGSETSDSIPARLSHNEHVWSAAEVRGAGGHAVMEQMRAWARAGVRGFADGGTPAYQYRPTFSAPAVNVSPRISLEGMRIVGSLDLGDGLEGRIDGRIAASMSGTRRSKRALTGGVR